MVERSPRRLIAPEERETILRMAGEGTPYRAIALATGRPQGTINGIISEGILAGRITRRYERLENRRS